MARKRAIIPNGRKQFSRSEASRKRPELDVGKRCVVFSFSQMTGCRVYNFEYFTDSKRTGEAAEKIKGFLDKLIDISSITWDEFHARPKATGYEPMSIDAMEESFLNGLSPRPKKGRNSMSLGSRVRTDDSSCAAGCRDRVSLPTWHTCWE